MDMKFKKTQKEKYTVKKINKKSFINQLQDNTNLSYDECLIVNDILENNFIFNKKKKDKVINELILKLNISNDRANEIYDVIMQIFLSEIKEKFDEEMICMKNWVKYLVSTVVFGLIYIVVEYLFYKNIDWKMVIVATILYGVFNIGISKIINKTTKKK